MQKFVSENNYTDQYSYTGFQIYTDFQKLKIIDQFQYRDL